MKKFVALMMVFVLCLCSAAFAAEVNWSDVEGAITEAGWEGDFVVLEQIACKVWVPSVMQAAELDQEDLDAGYIAYYMTEDEENVMYVTYVDVDDMDLVGYAELLPKYGATEITENTVNGIPCLTYDIVGADGFMTGCVAFATDAGCILEFAFTPTDDEGFAAVSAVMAASIQAE